LFVDIKAEGLYINKPIDWVITTIHTEIIPYKCQIQTI
jgi:hypothetical protein